jgi:hypothetical protein
VSDSADFYIPITKINLNIVKTNNAAGIIAQTFNIPFITVLMIAIILVALLGKRLSDVMPHKNPINEQTKTKANDASLSIPFTNIIESNSSA